MVAHSSAISNSLLFIVWTDRWAASEMTSPQAGLVFSIKKNWEATKYASWPWKGGVYGTTTCTFLLQRKTLLAFFSTWKSFAEEKQLLKWFHKWHVFLYSILFSNTNFKQIAQFLKFIQSELKELTLYGFFWCIIQISCFTMRWEFE